MKKITTLIIALIIAVSVAICLPSRTEAITIVAGGPGIAGFYGWEDYIFSGAGGSVDANVFFAVFAPGDTYNPYSTLYTYTYLIQNTLASTAISQFTVGIPPGIIGSIANVGSMNFVNDIWHNDALDLAPVGAPQPPFYQTDDAGVAPALANIGPSSVIYTFAAVPGYVSPGGHSLTLLYTSTYKPGFVTGSLQDGGGSQYKSVPGPIPEPTSLLLLGSGLLGLALCGGAMARKRKIIV